MYKQRGVLKMKTKEALKYLKETAYDGAYWGWHNRGEKKTIELIDEAYKVIKEELNSKG